MREKYFPPNKDSHDINLNLNLGDYATKDNLNALENTFRLLDYLNKKVDSMKDFSKTSIAELISATFFNSLSHYVASLK